MYGYPIGLGLVVEDKPSEFFMQWVNTLIGLGKQTNLHLPIEGMHWYVDWVQMNPHALP